MIARKLLTLDNGNREKEDKKVMTIMEIYDKMDEMDGKVGRIRILLNVVMDHYFNFRKADFNSLDEGERKNANKLCVTYEQYNTLIDIVCDIAYDMQKNIECFQKELEGVGAFS